MMEPAFIITQSRVLVELVKENSKFRVEIPASYRTGHEAHFSQVAKRYLEFLRQGDLPEWEVPNMLAKYYVTTKGTELSREGPSRPALRIAPR